MQRHDAARKALPGDPGEAGLTDHFGKVGRSLRGAVDDFNKAVGSFEGRVLPAARRFRELAVSGKQEIAVLEPIDGVPRDLTATSIFENGHGNGSGK